VEDHCLPISRQIGGPGTNDNTQEGDSHDVLPSLRPRRADAGQTYSMMMHRSSPSFNNNTSAVSAIIRFIGFIKLVAEVGGDCEVACKTIRKTDRWKINGSACRNARRWQ